LLSETEELRDRHTALRTFDVVSAGFIGRLAIEEACPDCPEIGRDSRKSWPGWKAVKIFAAGWASVAKSRVNAADHNKMERMWPPSGLKRVMSGGVG
jgi:hypothetical protein